MDLPTLTRVQLATGPAWSSADEDLLARTHQALAAIAGPRGVAVSVESDGALVLASGRQGRHAAGALRAAIGVLLAREHAADARRPAERQALQALDGLLQPALEARRMRGTFPSRRQAEQLAAFGYDPEDVARLIGLPFDAATVQASGLGLRLSTEHMLLNRRPSQLDVVADGDERLVSSIIGLHV